MPYKCNLCKDTGVIVTGNNDLPCTCEAGDTALFNQTGKDGKLETVPGSQVKKELHYNSNTHVGKTLA